MQEGAQQKYRKVGTDMVLFCLGLALQVFTNYEALVEEDEKAAAENFFQALQSDEEEQDVALQKFFFSLFTQNKRESSRFTLTIYRFLILYSFRPSGNLQKSSMITQYISAIVFFGRGAIFNEIQEAMRQTKTGFFE